VGTVSSYTFNHVTADHTISAIFSTDLEVNIHPNPFKDEIIIKIESPEDDHYGISILDMSEKTVYTLAKISGNIEIPINLHELAPGIYILKLYCKGNRIKTFRLLKY
jgi:hypothetical protein